MVQSYMDELISVQASVAILAQSAMHATVQKEKI